MPRIIHPNPIVAIAKAAVFALALSVALYLGRGFFQGFLLQALAFVWGVALLGCALAFISARFVTLEISEKNLLFKRGVLSVKTVLVSYSKVTDTRYTQSLAERLFGVGTLEVETASESGIPIRMPSVRYDDVKDIMQNVSDNAGERNEKK